MRSLFRIFTIFTSGQLRLCAILFVAMLVGAVLEAMGIGLILPLISLMGDVSFLTQHPDVAQVVASFGITTHTELVMAMTVGLIGVYWVKNIYIGLECWLQISFAMKFQIFYTHQLLGSYLRKPYEFFLTTNPAVVQRNINEGGRSVFTNILIPTFQLFTEMITALVIWLMLVLVDPFTAIVVAGVMGVMLYAIIKSFRRHITQQGILQNQYAAAMYKWINQSIGAVKETKVLRRERFFLKAFKEAYTVWGNVNRNFQFINQLPRLFIETAAVSGLLMLIVVKLLLGDDPRDIVPLMGVLALAAFRLMPSANRIVSTYNGVKFQMPMFNLLYEEFREIRQRQLDGLPLYPDVEEKKMPFLDRLEVKGVEYSYPGTEKTDGEDNRVLRGVGFVVPKGKFVGIIGQSGAGKTTFVDILLGLLRPNAGTILVDGTDIQSNIRGWQANLSYVPQSIYLIDGSIKENVALGLQMKDIDETRVRRVLEMAELADFVKTLPEGMDTGVGDRGVRLSGGQRQRIGIARALYTQPDVLILDEATSALDNETEESITNTILKLKGQITIISIAHRISTLKDCDFKVRFEGGKTELVR